MAKIEGKLLFALFFLKLACTFRLETKGATGGTGMRDGGADKFGPGDGWQQDRTILEQFYDYVKTERDTVEGRMGNRIFDLEDVVMKIPRRKDVSRVKRSDEILSQLNPQSENHISKIKEEMTKLQDLITILKDQQNIIGLLNNIGDARDPKFAKEFDDLKHFIKKSLVDKLEKEIQTRKTSDDNLLGELRKQKASLEKIQKKFFEDTTEAPEKSINNQRDVVDNIVKELRSLETHLSDLMNKKGNYNTSNNNIDDRILKSQEKMRKSTFEDLSEEEDETSILKRLLEEPRKKKDISLKKLIKSLNTTSKKKKQKNLLEELLNEIDNNKVENRDFDDDSDNIEDRLKLLKEEIENFQKPVEPAEDIESRKLQEMLKKLLTGIKPVETEPSIRKGVNLQPLIKKLAQQMSQNNNENQRKFNLYDCKYIQTSSDGVPYKIFDPNYGVHDNYYTGPINYGYGYKQQSYDQGFGQNQLFQNSYPPYFGQQRYNGEYPQESQTNSWKNFENNRYDQKPQIEDVRNQILSLQNVINDLNNQPYAQRIGDQESLYNLNQQMNDLKKFANNFPKTENGYQTQQYNGNNNFINGTDNQEEANQRYDANNKLGSSKIEKRDKTNNKHRNKRAASENLEESLLKVLKDELDQVNQEDSAEAAGNLNGNELDSNEEDINSKERGYYDQPGFRKKSFSKKVTVFDKIFDKFLDKIVDKAQIAIPKIIRAMFDLKSIFGVDLNFLNNNIDNNYDTSYSNHNNLGFKSFGLLGFLPLFILKLVSTFNSFMYQLQQFPFFKNFLVPALIVLGVSGLTVFLIWWLQSGNYKEITYQQNQKPSTYNLNGYYNDRYTSYPNYQPSYPPYSNTLHYNNNNYRNGKVNVYDIRRNK